MPRPTLHRSWHDSSIYNSVAFFVFRETYVYLNKLMQQTVYYLVHKETLRRLKYYRTLAGARIAQRARNHRLGFITRIERIELENNWEVELCRTLDNDIMEATYCIVEDIVDTEELFTNE